MKAGILTIGDEILMGQITDTNSAYLAQKLTDHGYEVIEIDSVGDREVELVQTLNRMLKSCSILILTGGLGPTKDDLTKHTLCAYFKDTLLFYPDIYAHIEQIFTLRGGPQMSELNKGQAYLPQKARILKNLKGTASGMWFEEEQHLVISLPGVPFEMEYLMEQEVLPLLEQRFPAKDIQYKTLITYDIAESLLSEKLSSWEEALPCSIKMAYLPSPGSVKLRLTQYGGNNEQLQSFFSSLQETLHQSSIFFTLFSEKAMTLEKQVGEALLQQKATLSTAESCTGGYIAHKITTVPGASQYFIGSIISYANSAKEHLLNVPSQILQTEGAVSEAAVKAMAWGALKEFGSTYAIATSGIAGPSGGSIQKPVGTIWIAIAGPKGCHAQCFHFSFSRERNIEKAGIKALLLLLENLA